jgi:hypothetical protein
LPQKLEFVNGDYVKQEEGVSHRGLAIYIKQYLKSKRRIMETRIFSPCNKYNLQKKSSKKTKIFQDIITL